MSNHGGKRSGSGRKLKWDANTRLEIALACENKWDEASKQAFQDRLAKLAYVTEIQKIQEGLQRIPIPNRTSRAAQNILEELSGDLDSFLHAQNHTPFDEASGEYQGDAPRVLRLSSKPHRGTRKKIIREIAQSFDLDEQAVDNLWQEYRRLIASKKT